MEYNEDEFNRAMIVTENIVKCFPDDYSTGEGIFSLIIVLSGLIREYPNDMWPSMVDEVRDSLKYKLDFPIN